MEQLRARLSSLEARMEAVEASTRSFADKLAENTKITRRIETMLSDNNELLVAISSGIKVTGYLAAFLKWGSAVAAGVATTWVAIKGFGK